MNRLPAIGSAEPGFARRVAAFVAARLRVALVVYGIVFAVVGVVRLDHAIQRPATQGLNTERQRELHASLDVFDDHGPPLTGLGSDAVNSFYPIATDDDRGAFVYIPVAAYVVGTHDLDAILKWLFIACFVPLLLLYPLLIYEATGSIAGAVAAPPLLLHYSSFLRESGLFWVPAWANLLLLPILLLIAKRWRPSSLWILVALAAVASFASSIRANAGVGFVIGALIVVFLRIPERGRRLVGALLIVLAYLSISTFAMRAIQTQRDDVVGSDYTSPFPNGHPFWHNAYIGLGYLKNPYGLRSSDYAALAAAHAEDPGAEFPTKRYEHALRKVYFHILAQHPGFVVREYATKSVVVLGWARRWFSGAIVLVPLLLLFGARRRARQAQFLLMLGTGVVGFATGVVTVPTPIPETEASWYAFLLLLWLLSIGWVAAPMENRALAAVARLAQRTQVPVSRPRLPWTHRRALAIRFRLLGERAAHVARAGRAGAARISAALPMIRPSSASLARGGIAAALIVAAAIVGASGRAANARAAYWNREAGLVERAAIRGETVASWQLGRRVPRDWHTYAAQLEPSKHRLSLRTTAGAYAFQLTSPPRLLEPGDYAALVDGRVVRGGLQMAVIDARISRTIGQSFYWSGQTYTAATRMFVSFTLARPTLVYLALANFSDLGNPSLWSLRSFDLVRQRGGCQLSTPYAWFTPAASGSP